MLIDETDPARIEVLYNKLLNNPGKVKRLAVEFTNEVNLSEFLTADLESTNWPLAVDPLLIATDSLQDRIDRAELITSMLLPPVNGLKFLDFGCGDGTVAWFAANQAALSVGMDPNNTGWDKLEAKPNLLLYQNRDELLQHAPFDVILAYDVFDHMGSEEEAQENLKFLAKLLKHGGQLKVRFHPWTSRHATHSYHTFNKAYAHLVLSKEELVAKGHGYTDCLKITEPVITYTRWMKAAGLRTLNSNMTKELVEDYFKQPHIAHVLKQNWKNSQFKIFNSGEQLPVFQMEMGFLDYTLIHQPVATM